MFDTSPAQRQAQAGATKTKFLSFQFQEAMKLTGLELEQNRNRSPMKFISHQEANHFVRCLKSLGRWPTVVMFLTALATVPANATVKVTPAEMALKNNWVNKNLLDPAKVPPFSFTLDGKPSAILLPSWKRVAARRALDANRTERVTTWTDAASGLVVRCVALEYSDYP